MRIGLRASVAAALLPLAAPPLPAQPREPSAADLAARGVGDELLQEIRVGAPPGAPTLGLDAALRRALEFNFGLLSSADAVASSRLRESAARAAFAPQLTPLYRSRPEAREYGFEGSQRLPWSGGTVTASGSVLSPRVDGVGGRRSAFRLSVTQPLLRGFGPTVSRFALDNSVRVREARERELELARQRLAVDVTAAYYQVVRQRQLLEVARRSVRRSERLREASEARMRVGMDSRLDVLRAELQAAQSREAVVSSRAALETALERFRMLLGLAPDDPLEPAGGDALEAGGAPPEPLEVLVGRAIERRLELRESRDRVRDAERSHAVAANDLLPQVDLTLSFARLGAGTGIADPLLPDQRLDVFITASYPLERSSARVNREIAALALTARKRDLRQRELQVEAEVRAAARDQERIRKSVELRRKSVEVAGQQYRLATLRYQRGLASNFDVIEAEGSLVSARTALAGLLAELQVSRIRLLLVTGSLDLEAELR